MTVTLGGNYSLHILYFIGNGFDIAAGLPTDSFTVIHWIYEQLRDQLLEDPGDEALRLITESINRDFDTWSDYERALGEFTAEVESLYPNDVRKVLELIEAGYRHFVTALTMFMEYINEQLGSADLISDHQALFFADKCFNLFGDLMAPRDQRRIDDAYDVERDAEIRFISFNYTDLLDKLIRQYHVLEEPYAYINDAGYPFTRSMAAPLHVHESIAEQNGIVLGVGSMEQIKGDVCRSDPRLSRILSKPDAVEYAGQTKYEEAIAAIEWADIICVYGMSFGESDVTWWQRIGEWLASDSRHLLLINTYREPAPRKLFFEDPDTRIKARELFCRRAGLVYSGAPDGADDLDRRIIVVINGKLTDVEFQISPP